MKDTTNENIVTTGTWHRLRKHRIHKRLTNGEDSAQQCSHYHVTTGENILSRRVGDQSTSNRHESNIHRKGVKG
jgi:hypothetical protein